VPCGAAGDAGGGVKPAGQPGERRFAIGAGFVFRYAVCLPFRLRSPSAVILYPLTAKARNRFCRAEKNTGLPRTAGRRAAWTVWPNGDIPWSFLGHQLGPGTAQRQLDSNESCAEKVELARFDLLQISRFDFSAFGQLFLGQFLGATLPANVGAENDESVLFFAA
jgi:hypothetical protein